MTNDGKIRINEGFTGSKLTKVAPTNVGLGKALTGPSLIKVPTTVIPANPKTKIITGR